MKSLSIALITGIHLAFLLFVAFRITGQFVSIQKQQATAIDLFYDEAGR